MILKIYSKALNQVETLGQFPDTRVLLSQLLKIKATKFKDTTSHFLQCTCNGMSCI